MFSGKILISATVLFLANPVVPACADTGSFLGTGLGAIAGGVVGSQIGRGGGRAVATGVGVVTGAVIGNQVGQSIDNANRSNYPLSPSYSYDPDGTPFSAGYVPYTANYVAPPAMPPIYVDPSAGTYCRPFSQEILIDGQRQESYGTACLQPDGTWRVTQ